MPILIILVYGEDRKLVEKPATYDNLLKVARNKFPEVEHASNNEIAFHFTPAWFNDEVELDGTSFADVHARAILRITTAASASAQHPGNDDDEIQDDSVVGPIPALSGALPPLGRMRLFVLFYPTTQKVCYHMRPSTPMECLKEKVATDFAVNAGDYNFMSEDYTLEDEDTPSSTEMKPNDLIVVCSP